MTESIKEKIRILYGDLYLADLIPVRGTEAGKVRPVLVVQTNLLNEQDHGSTWILPCTTRLTGESLLRVYLPQHVAGNDEACEVMIDQSRAIDNRRFKKHLGPLPGVLFNECREKLKQLGEL